MVLKRLREACPDLVLILLSLVSSLGSLAYPFGRDQGLYFYVGREWVLRGAIPYRDVLDHKTPGIYVLYGLGVWLFGENMWGIRVLDLIGIGIAAWFAALLSASPGERVRPGVLGTAWLGLTMLYFGYLDFWNTGQSELWYATLAVGALAAAFRIERLHRAALAAGIASGFALLMKPTAAGIVLVAALWLVDRSIQRGDSRRARVLDTLRTCAIFAIGAATPIVVVLGYFAAHGALNALIDIVVGANGYYVKHERGASGTPVAMIVDYVRAYAPAMPVLLGYVLLAFGIYRRDRSVVIRHGLALLAVLGALAGVVMQGKYYFLHFVAFLPPLTIVIANGARQLGQALQRRSIGWSLPIASAAVIGGLYWGAQFTERPPTVWVNAYRHMLRYERGIETRADFAKTFEGPAFSYEHSQAVGDWLREHTGPSDLVSVRGFQPEIYAVARRHHGGRFFWTTFITAASRLYRREEWLREDWQSFVDHPPKYIVALNFARGGPDSAAYFAPLGYRPALDIYEYTILQRGP